MEVKLDAVEYMNALCTWNNPPKWSDRWSKKVAWACEIIVERDERIAELTAENKRLSSQLPEGMQDCTIVFLECDKGHGRLTATNWIDCGCQTCEIDELEADNAMSEKMMNAALDTVKELTAENERLRDALEELLDAWDGYEMLAALDADVYRKARAALEAAKGKE